MKDPRLHRIDHNTAYAFPQGTTADFILDRDFRAMCADAGIESEDPDEFAEVYDYNFVVSAQQIGGSEGWLCFF